MEKKHSIIKFSLTMNKILYILYITNVKYLYDSLYIITVFNYLLMLLNWLSYNKQDIYYEQHLHYT